MPSSAPRASPFGQPSHFPSPASLSGVPVGSPPFSRPGPPPGALSRAAVSPTGPPQSTLPPNVLPRGRPTGPPTGQPSFIGSRTPPGSSPLSGGSTVPPTYMAPSPGAFPSSGFPSRPVGSAPPPGTRPSTASPHLTAGLALPHSSAPSGYVSNGPPAFMLGASPGGPRFPPAGNAPQPSIGPPLTMGSAGAAPQAQSMRSFLASSAVVASPGPPPVQQASPFFAPPGPPAQPASPFAAPPQGVPMPPGSYGQPTWPLQPGQVRNEYFSLFNFFHF